MERISIEEAKRRQGEEVTIAGWVSRVRDIGGIKFILLRDITDEMQITLKPGEAEPALFELRLGREDVISVTGRAQLSEIAHRGFELIPKRIILLNRSKQPLPLDVSGRVKAELETRLNHRFMDLRTPRTRAIFKIQHELLAAFRRYLNERGYMEIQPPCIISSASEGGADLFKIPYFEKEAYLAQSPQLYKQMCAISLEKVYTVVPVWRAEKFNTPTHLNEVRQLDIEQAFADDEDVMEVLEETLANMIDSVKSRCSRELAIIGRALEVPRLPLKRVSYTEAVGLLRNSGEEMVWGEDFTKSQEAALTRLVGEEAFFIRDWPSTLKPFYAMPYRENPEIVHAFDLIYGGIEVSSGTQRIHEPELLEAQLLKKGLDPKGFTHYIECFSYGAPPHAGWSIGLERLTMAVTGMSNIRECCMFPRDRDRLVP